MSENPSIASRTDAQHGGEIDAQHVGQIDAQHRGQIDARHAGQMDARHRDLAEIPAVEVISRAAVMLMSAAAEKLGLSDPDPDDSEHRDLDEARRLIAALAGLVTAAMPYLGPHAGPLRDGVTALQRAFREGSAIPDEPGQGPGETYTGPVR